MMVCDAGSRRRQVLLGHLPSSWANESVLGNYPAVVQALDGDVKQVAADAMAVIGDFSDIQQDSSLLFIREGLRELIAYVNCIVYAGSGGADAYGNPGKVAKSTYRFSTYKNQGERYIRLLSCVDNNGRNITNEEYENDNGFLLSIFWKAADRVGISQYLD